MNFGCSSRASLARFVPSVEIGHSMSLSPSSKRRKRIAGKEIVEFVSTGLRDANMFGCDLRNGARSYG
jgi:hypothetical protein